MVMWVFFLVLLVGFLLTFVGVACSLYFYRRGLVQASRAEKFRSLSTNSSDAENRRALEERRFYRDLAVVEGGPTRASLLILSVIFLLLFGLIISGIISAFVH